MRIAKTKSAISNIVFGLINKIVVVIFPFLIKTIIINYLGTEYLGLNSLFSSILNILNFAELGFGTAMVFSMYKPIAEDDEATICALLKLYKKIYKIIGAIVCVVGLFVSIFLKYLITDNITHVGNINIYILFYIYLFNTVVGYFFSAYKVSLFTAHQKNNVTSLISTAVNLIMYLLQIVTLLVTENYYIYIVVLPLCTILNNVIISYVTKKVYPQYICKGEVKSELKQQIKTKVTGLICHKVGYVIQSSIDSIAISIAFGLVMNGIYSNYMYIVTAVQSFVVILFNSLIASIGNNIEKESVDNNYTLFKRIFLVNAWVVGFCSICLLCLYQPFMAFWNKKDAPLSLFAVILFVSLFFTNNITNTVGVFRDAKGLWDKDKLRPLIISAVNLVGTIISAYFNYIEGIILSTVVAYVVVCIPWVTYILFKYYFNRSMKEYFMMLLYSVLVTVVAALVTYLICKLLPSYGKMPFALKICICCVVPNIIFLCSYFWTKEFKYWGKKFTKIIGETDKTNNV